MVSLQASKQVSNLYLLMHVRASGSCTVDVDLQPGKGIFIAGADPGFNAGRWLVTLFYFRKAPFFIPEKAFFKLRKGFEAHYKYLIVQLLSFTLNKTCNRYFVYIHLLNSL